MSQGSDRRATSDVRERARHRLDILARQLERTGLSDPSVLTEGAPPGRAELRSRVETAAAGAGLGDVLADARARFQGWVEGAYNRSRSDLKTIGWNYAGRMGPVGDRVDVYLALDDAVLATVAREVVSEDDRQALARAISPDDGDPPRAERPTGGLIRAASHVSRPPASVTPAGAPAAPGGAGHWSPGRSQSR